MLLPLFFPNLDESGANKKRKVAPSPTSALPGFKKKPDQPTKNETGSAAPLDAFAAALTSMSRARSGTGATPTGIVAAANSTGVGEGGISTGATSDLALSIKKSESLATDGLKLSKKKKRVKWAADNELEKIKYIERITYGDDDVGDPFIIVS